VIKSGAVRIFLYNWPIYVGTWTVSVVAMLVGLRTGGLLGGLVVAGASAATLWSALSLLVSHYVYDRSALASGAWVPSLLAGEPATWATIDAGLDAEVALDGVVPGTCIARLDMYDGEQVRAPSVRRARALTPRAHAATQTLATALPLAGASCDLVAVVFSAHELRNLEHRQAFFAEVHRVLRQGGRMLLVEHLRDVPNFVAFGPGFVHFLPRAEWLRLAQHAGFRVAIETRVTPWVMALALEKIA